MKKYNLIIVASFFFTLFIYSCKDESASKPKAGFELMKATSVFDYPSDTVKLSDGPFTVGDTLVFISHCTGEHNYIFVGDTIYNSAGGILKTHLADQEFDRTLDPTTGDYVRAEAFLFPQEGQSLNDLYGYRDKDVFMDENGNFYRGIITYTYKYAASFKVKAYSVNYSNDGDIYSMDSFSQVIDVLPIN